MGVLAKNYKTMQFVIATNYNFMNGIISYSDA